ncbi:MAG: PLP-dependent aminotransferase family protein [bacterium]|nr:PLP-dependent aminotransferase family protein [bacterium]
MNKKKYNINNRLFHPYLERMNFLNEISIDYPEAISFGSGRPDARFFSVKETVSSFQNYSGSRQQSSEDSEEFYNSLGQYNKTKGIVNEGISKLLRNDENVEADPGDIILTDGAQEGMAIVINSLIETREDVILVSEPSYIGFVGYAKIYGAPVVAIKRDKESISLEHLEETILRLKKEGKNPKVLYEVPDFHNPTGTYMPLEKRKQLLQLAETHNFLIVEDNPYGYFRFDVEKIPTLIALDKNQRVIHLGSFAKTLFPALRLGYLVVPQTVIHNGKEVKLVEEFKKTKSFITVNTSPLLQAMAGSYLHKHDYSLKETCIAKVQACKTKRDAMIEAFQREFPAGE